MKVVSYRSCLITHKRYLKAELIRLVVNDGLIKIDKTKSVKSRGYYLHPSSIMLDNRFITRLERTLKAKFSPGLVEELKEYE